MADYRATSTEFTAVADAIRTKGGTSAQLTWPNGFVSAVQAIPTGSGVVQPLNVQQNGTYSPPSGVDGFAPVVVDVSGGSSSPWNEQFCVNWDFTNPINTNGQTEYYSSGSAVATFDGWFATTNGKVTLTNQGIVLEKYNPSGNTGFFIQGLQSIYADKMVGQTMTLSVIVDNAVFQKTDIIAARGNGSHGINPGFSDLFFRLYHYPDSGVWGNMLGITIDMIGANASNHVIKAMKLECGSQQTLATMVGGVPVLNKSMVMDEESIKLVSVRTS